MASLATDLRLIEEEDAANQQMLVKSICNVGNSAQQFYEDNERKRQEEKSNFNVFNCLTRHHLEELHSRFIAYLLDPKEDHDCGALFLELFLQTIEFDEVLQNIVRTNKADIQAAKVYRELVIDPSDEVYGRIDIYITTPQFCIAVENKIYAGDQEEQTWRYSEYCKRFKKPFTVLYLTLDGAMPSGAGSECCTCISYRQHILPWLAAASEHLRGFPHITSGIGFYADLLNRKILNQNSSIITMDIKKVLLKSDNLLVLKYWSQITAAVDNIKKSTYADLFDKLAGRLKAEGYQFFAAEGRTRQIEATAIAAKKWRGFTFTSDHITLPIDRNHNIHFCIEHDGQSLYCGLFIHKQTGKALENDENFYGRSITKAKIETIKKKLTAMTSSELWFEHNWIPYMLIDYKDNDLFNTDMLYILQTEMSDTLDHITSEINRFIGYWSVVVLEIKATNT